MGTSREDNWVVKLLHKKMRVMTAYDRQTKQNFIWTDLKESEIREIKEVLYRGRPRFKNLEIEYEESHHGNEDFFSQS